MRPTLLAFALAALPVLAMPNVHAADHTDLTLYRSDAGDLYSSTDGTSSSGYALVHERRDVSLLHGPQVLNFDGLPATLDSEALDVDFGTAATIASRRLLLPDAAGVLSTRVGSTVSVLGPSGNTLAEGTLRSTQQGLLVDTPRGAMLVRDYAGVLLPGEGDVRSGARLQLQVDAPRAGTATARLDYPTGGLGWRAAYGAVLHDGTSCRMEITSLASIANRSGRDWHVERLTLVAGEPNFAKFSGPRPAMAMRSMAASVPAPAPLPEQSALGDYRRFVLPNPIDLPDASVTQVPLYEVRTLDCTRSQVFENGNTWTAPKPMLGRDYGGGSGTISSRLAFAAFDSLPAGYLRVLTVADGNREFIGEARIPDTAKDRPVAVEIGTPFDLAGKREQTAFTVDRAAHTLDEGWRITLTNSGDKAATVTVREHPNRWREWQLATSSAKPVRQTRDTLDFAISVPAHGTTSLDYAVRYHWSATDE